MGDVAGSEGAVGPNDSVIISNWADSCLSKGVGVFIPRISIRDEEHVDIVLGGVRVAPGMIRRRRGVVEQADSV